MIEMTLWIQIQGKRSSISTWRANRNRHERGRENGNNKQADHRFRKLVDRANRARFLLPFLRSKIAESSEGEIEAILNGLATNDRESSKTECRPLSCEGEWAAELVRCNYCTSRTGTIFSIELFYPQNFFNQCPDDFTSSKCPTRSISR